MTKTFETSQIVKNSVKTDGSVSMTGDLDLDGNDIVDVNQINGSSFARRNYVINGDFHIAQRGITHANVLDSTYTLDRWMHTRNGTGANVDIYRADFPHGNTEINGNNPGHYLRFNQTVAGAGGAWNTIGTRLEDVRKYQDKQVTLTFWMKGASGSFTLPQVVARQHFGSGGSAVVDTTVASSVAVTSGFTKFSYTIDLPSISGKTLGTGSYLWLFFDLPLNVVQEIFLTHVSLVDGDATGEDDPYEQRSFVEELFLCQRYYRILPALSGFMNEYNTGAIFAVADSLGGMRSGGNGTFIMLSGASKIHRSGIAFYNISSTSGADKDYLDLVPSTTIGAEKPLTLISGAFSMEDEL